MLIVSKSHKLVLLFKFGSRRQTHALINKQREWSYRVRGLYGHESGIYFNIVFCLFVLTPDSLIHQINCSLM